MILAQPASDVLRSPYRQLESCSAFVTTKIDHIGYVRVPKIVPLEEQFFATTKEERPAKRQRCFSVTSTMTTSKKRSVRFADQDEIIDVGRQWSPQEIQNSWHSHEDVARMKHHNKLCIVAFHKVGCKASRLPPHYCIRGLEQVLSRQKLIMIRYVRKESIRAVLASQEKASDLVSHRLRAISESKSREKVKDAIKMAAKDSRIWMEEYRENFL